MEIKLENINSCHILYIFSAFNGMLIYLLSHLYIFVYLFLIWQIRSSMCLFWWREMIFDKRERGFVFSVSFSIYGFDKIEL